MQITIKTVFDSDSKEKMFNDALMLREIKNIPSMQHHVYNDGEEMMFFRTEFRRQSEIVFLNIFHHYSQIISEVIPAEKSPHELLDFIKTLLCRKAAWFIWDNKDSPDNNVGCPEYVHQVPENAVLVFKAYFLGLDKGTYRIRCVHDTISSSETLVQVSNEADEILYSKEVSSRMNFSELPKVIDDMLWKIVC